MAATEKLSDVTIWLFDAWINQVKRRTLITDVSFPIQCIKKTAHKVLFSQVGKINVQHSLISLAKNQLSESVNSFWSVWTQNQNESRSILGVFYITLNPVV